MKKYKLEIPDMIEIDKLIHLNAIQIKKLIDLNGEILSHYPFDQVQFIKEINCDDWLKEIKNKPITAEEWLKSFNGCTDSCSNIDFPGNFPECSNCEFEVNDMLKAFEAGEQNQSRRHNPKFNFDEYMDTKHPDKICNKPLINWARIGWNACLECHGLKNED